VVNDSSTTPVVILAFANDQDAYLQMIVKERKGIAKALQDHDDRRYLKVVKEENTSIVDVFDLCTRYGNRIAIFHYGGHASGTQLQLEAATGATELANATGLAQLLGQQQGLQLVFLNGCATLDQVQTLFACGVKAVIATAVPINDVVATDFAEQFYLSLAAGATIAAAFQTAKAFVATRPGDAREVSEFRAVNFGAKTEGGAKESSAASSMPWGLYVNTAANGEAAVAWTLPKVAEHQVVIRGAAPSATSKVTVNAALTQALFNAVARLRDDVGYQLEAAKRSKRPLEPRIVNKMIVDSFPAPVAEQLRKLFAGTTIDVPRLRQLVMTYETVAELVCFTALSQLWNARHDTPTLALKAEDAAVIDGVLALTKDGQATFDYLGLIEVVARFFREHAMVPFIDEFAGLGDLRHDEAFDSARRFMEQMRVELVRGRKRLPASACRRRLTSGRFCRASRSSCGISWPRSRRSTSSSRATSLQGTASHRSCSTI
jgi:hypothetical protein